jgi:magnesium-transporting ATPase (P-type)
MNMNSMQLEVDGMAVEVELLKSFEFNSDRKRMSVIIRQEGIVGTKSFTKLLLYLDKNVHERRRFNREI